MDSLRNPSIGMMLFVFILIQLSLFTHGQILARGLIRYNYTFGRYQKVFANCSTDDAGLPSPGRVDSTEIRGNEYELTKLDFDGCIFAPESWNLVNMTYENVSSLQFVLNKDYQAYDTPISENALPSNCSQVDECYCTIGVKPFEGSRVRLYMNHDNEDDSRDVYAEVLWLKISYEAAYLMEYAITVFIKEVQNYGELVVNCSGPQGYVQTSRWENLELYSIIMDTCVTLHAPPGHVTFLSLVSLDVELDGSRCYDKLYIVPGSCHYHELSRDDETVIFSDFFKICNIF